MRIGIQVDMRNPVESSRSWPDHYAHWLDLLDEADRLGCDAVWLPEHHVFDDGYLAQPLSFAAAIAVRTRKMRIGTAVTLASIHPPAQLAEQAALVDILSNGRVELGLGVGYRLPEFEVYGADFERRFRSVRHCLAELPRLFESVITPPPVQRPVPLWLGTNTERGAREAGRRGAGLLSFNGKLLNAYLAGIEEAGKDRSSARMAAWMFAIVADDPDRAYDEVAPHFMYIVNSYRRHMVQGTGKPPPPTLPVSAVRSFTSSMLPALEVLSPDQAVSRILDICDGLPVTDFWFPADFGAMPDALVSRHIELVSTKVRDGLRAALEDRSSRSSP
jgi:alkanesulfonate monooxygenase SsuD/methylene tetrahydromethanopterin reductase-like flavin-dependent oxidoreductase (luciferase family)